MKGRITIVCEQCGVILKDIEVSDKEFEKSKDVPLRIKQPVCSVCSKIKKEWIKK
jgi:tRNA(Ile)-lysidine synthase TilS/MesJ